MDKKTILIKTPEGVAEVGGKGNVLSGDLKRVLFLIDDKSTFEEISKRAAPSLRAVLPEVLAQLLAEGYVRDSAAAQIVKPKVIVPVNGELDFTAMPSNTPVNTGVATGAADTRAALEAAVEAAKSKARAEAEAKAEANAKLAAEDAAKDKAATEARARQDATARAQTEERLKQEAAARVRAEQVAVQAKLQLEAAAQATAAAEAEAARSKAEQVRMAEEAARARAEAEAKALAEARARQEAEVLRLQAEQAAAQAKAEAEALARQQIEAARAQAEAAAKAKAEAEAARQQAEQEAARARAELEAARAKAEAQAKTQAEERVRQEAEAARLKAEHEAARIKAEQDAAQARAEAAERSLAEEQAREQSELARAQAAEEHLRVQAELEAMKAASLEQEKRAREQVAAGAAAEAPRDVETSAAARQADQATQQRLADEQAKAWAAAEQRAKELARAEAERPAQEAAAEAPVKVTPPKQRKRRSPWPWGKIVAGLALSAVIAIVSLPYLMPLDRYVAPLEQALSEQFKQPVRVGSLQASVFPWPTLRLEKVTLGKAQELAVDNVELRFDPLALFSEVKTIREVELNEVTVQAAALARQWSWLQVIGVDANHPVRHVTLSQVRIAGADIPLPELGGEMMLDGQGRIERMRFTTVDAKLDAELHGGQGRWQLVLNARENALPVFADVALDDFTAQGEVTAAGIDLTLFKAQAYGGFLEGKGRLGWQQGWQLQGNFEARGIELGKLFPAFGVSGELAGKARLAATANKLARLAANRQLTASFVLKKGVINGIDMVETTRQGTHPASGGRTHLDELSGELQMNGNVRHFGPLQFSSGILRGTGAFDVINGGQLAGRFSVDLKAGAGGAVPLLLSGTLDKPVLRAGR